MGGTIERLHAQGHTVHIACMTSGDLRVTDAEALRFARVLEETAEIDPARWAEATRYASGVIEEIESKGMFGDPPRRLRDLKTLIRRGEARDAARSLGVPEANIHFLDLPFYAEGRYRQFKLTTKDAARTGALLDRLQPHQIYITGDQADPSSVQGMAFAAFRQAMNDRASAPWRAHCRVWLYRCHQHEFEPHEIQMAVPMSPDQTAQKLAAAHKFLTHSLTEHLDGSRNRETARLYDKLGMAEYEAIEAFKQWKS
jgi:glucosamine-6-phosphate deaminase